MYDLIVIGGGPGGYAASIRAAQLGGKVAIVEAAEMGGTCVNRGCIPSKVWMRAAHAKKTIESAGDFGLDASINSIDFSVVINRKNGVSGDIRMGMEGLLANNGIEVIVGRGSIKAAGEVEVDGETYQAKSIIIATGSVLDIPNIPGLVDAAITTDQVFEMTEIPTSILIIGGGHIEVEMAFLFSTFGAAVTMVVESARILPEEDGDTSQRMSGVLREMGIEIIGKSNVASVEKNGPGLKVQVAGPGETEVEVEQVLVCSRRPNTQGLGLGSIGINLTDDGAVSVDAQLQTEAAGVYAIGDAIGGRMLSHAATAMGITAAENAMGDEKEFPHHLVPRGLFTMPEVGSVGLSEEEAEEQGMDVETGDFPISINGLAMAYSEMEGAVKVVTDSEYGEVVGIHIVGSRATELIGIAVMAMQLESSAEDLARSIMVHPTFSEALVMASQDAGGWALYLPKG